MDAVSEEGIGELIIALVLPSRVKLTTNSAIEIKFPNCCCNYVETHVMLSFRTAMIIKTILKQENKAKPSHCLTDASSGCYTCL